MDGLYLQIWAIAGTAFTMLIGFPWAIARFRDRSLRAERARLARLLPENVSIGKGLILGTERKWLETDGVAPGLHLRTGDAVTPTSWTEPGSGDPLFDAEVVVSGNMFMARALLDAPTRAAVREAMRVWGDAAEGVIRVGRYEEVDANDQARALVALAERLRLLPDEEVLTRLVELSQGDPSPLVRALCFDAFAERGAPGSARALARTLLTDTDPRVVVRAAGWLGDEAADRLAAFRVSKDTTVRTLAVRCTARLRNAVKLLVAHQATQGDSEVVALALAETGDPAAEAPLIALLSVPGDVGVAAARGLGLIGTARAIPALFALGTPEAKAAIAQIHLRIPDAGEGRISIAEGGGELSVTEAGGELSVAGGAELSALLPEQDEPTEHSG